MNWTVLYITGRKGFSEEVDKRLYASGLNIMPGYENGVSTDGSQMYWIPDTLAVREVKEAIGAKLIWKYRLVFSGHPQPAKPGGQENVISFTESEKALVRQMRKKMKNVA